MRDFRFKMAMFLLMVMAKSMLSQDSGLMFLKGSLPATYINPSIPLEKNINISMAGINVFAGTDGLAIEDITSKNAAGKRYIDVSELGSKLKPENNIFGELDIHTLDAGVRIGNLTIIGGHALKSIGNIKYPGKLAELLARGNVPFIGQTLDIGTAINFLEYNELYLGGQVKTGSFSLGIKGKLLFGSNNLTSERYFLAFNTKPEIYQWELETDYIVRNSGVLNYQSLDSVSVDLESLSFKNLFARNQGLGIDLGISWQIDEKLLLLAGASDLGSITWDFNPKKYTSNGTFTFEGVDIIDLLGNKDNISISDTLLDIIKVQTESEKYNTPLNSQVHLGGFYELNNRWSFNGLYTFQKRFDGFSNQLSLSALLKFSLLHAGMTYSISKNNFTSLGIYGKLNAGPLSLYLHGENITGFFNPLKSRAVGLRLGTTLQF